MQAAPEAAIYFHHPPDHLIADGADSVRWSGNPGRVLKTDRGIYMPAVIGIDTQAVPGVEPSQTPEPLETPLPSDEQF
jgi:hypothetical protein